MKILKAVFGTIFVCLLAVFWGLFLFLGVIGLALGDLFRRLGRRCTARMRGDRYGRGRGYNPAPYVGPRLMMDADGFVEPPVAQYTGPRLVSVSTAEVVTLVRPTDIGPASRSTDIASASRSTDIGSQRSYRGYAASNCQDRVANPGKGLVVHTNPNADKLSPRTSAPLFKGVSASLFGASNVSNDSTKLLKFPGDAATRERMRVARRSKPVVSSVTGNVVHLTFPGRRDGR